MNYEQELETWKNNPIIVKNIKRKMAEEYSKSKSVSPFDLNQDGKLDTKDLKLQKETVKKVIKK